MGTPRDNLPGKFTDSELTGRKYGSEIFIGPLNDYSGSVPWSVWGTPSNGIRTDL